MKRHQLQIFGALVLSIIALAFTMSAPTHSAAASPAFAPVTAVPLYRLYHSNPYFHFYTADKNEKDVIKGQPGWTEEQQEGFCFPKQVPGTVKLYRVGKGEFGGSQHFYTIDLAQVKEAAPGGWKNEGEACYVSPTQIPGTVPLYFLYLPLTEAGQEAKDKGTHVEDLVGNLKDSVSLAGAPFEDAVSVIYGDDHFYTIDEKQKFEAIAQGYQLVRKEAYVWTQPVTLGASPKPEPPAPLPESYYTDQLFNFGCKKVWAGINCPTKQGYFDCEYYRKQGNIKAPACIAGFDLAGFNKLEASLVKLGCKRFLGRPGEYICESWDSVEACDSALKTSNGLITKCFTPRTWLVSSYKDSFGREPTAKESDYWAGEIKAKKLTYKDLMKANSQWIKTPAASAERKAVANRSVYEAFGRYPSPDEVSNIADTIGSNGTSYADLVKGHVAWMTGGNPQQNQELRAMIGRAFTSAKKAQPTEFQYIGWMNKVKAQKLTFLQFVALLKK